MHVRAESLPYAVSATVDCMFRPHLKMLKFFFFPVFRHGFELTVYAELGEIP